MDAMPSNPSSEVTPVAIDYFRDRLFEYMKSQAANKLELRRMAFVVDALEKMGLHTTADLAKGSDFLERFLDAWGRSIRYPAVRSALTLLTRACAFAASQGYLSKSSFAQTRFLVPPSWDEADPAFSQSGRQLPRHTLSGRPPYALEWDEIARFISHLKSEANTWMGCRRFALVAVVILTKLNLLESTNIKHSDIDLKNRSLFVSRRKGLRSGHARAIVSFGSILEEIFDRWLPRSHSEWVFPNQTHTGPWGLHARTKDRATFELAHACQRAGVRTINFAALRDFGHSNSARLSDPIDSPFFLPPNSNDLKPQCIPLTELRDRIIFSYKNGSTDANFRSMVRRTFRVLDRMGLSESSGLMGKDVVDRFMEAEHITDQSIPMNKFRLRFFHRVCGKAIALGHLDVDPFVGRPGFVKKGPNRGPDRPKPTKPTKQYQTRVNLEAMLAFPPIPDPDKEVENKSVVEFAGESPKSPKPWIGTQEQLDREVAAIESDASRESFEFLLAESRKTPPPRITKVYLERHCPRGDAYNSLRKMAKSGTRLGSSINMPSPGKREGIKLVIKILSS